MIPENLSSSPGLNLVFFCTKMLLQKSVEEVGESLPNFPSILNTVYCPGKVH